MKPIIHTALSGLAAVLVLTGTAAAKPSSPAPSVQRPYPALTTTDGAPVELAASPGSDADKLARQLMAHELERDRQHGENPLVLVGMGRLNDSDEMLFVQLQSAGDCGSAGCNTVSFRFMGGRWVRVMDSIGSVRIGASSHHGMLDLIVQDADRLTWDGQKYVGHG
jgi:hypothetical protein